MLPVEIYRITSSGYVIRLSEPVSEFTGWGYYQEYGTSYYSD